MRFRLGSLRQVGNRWTVDAEVFMRDGKVRLADVEPIALALCPEIAEWMSSIREVVLAGMPDAERASARLLCSKYYDVETAAVDGVRRVVRVHPNVVRAASESPAPDLEGVHGPSGPPEVLELAVAMRSFLEEVVWPEAKLRLADEDCFPPPGSGLAVSHGMCRISATSLLPIVRGEFPEGTWKVSGGHPSVAYVRYDSRERRQFLRAFDGMDGGIWDRLNGQWDGHYWIEGEIGGDGVIVDLAADQFGWDEVVVTGPDDVRYRANYTAETVKKDMSGRLIPRLRALALDAWESRRAAVDGLHPAP